MYSIIRHTDAEDNLVVVFEQDTYKVNEDIGLNNYALRVCVNVTNSQPGQAIIVSTLSETATGKE